MHARKIKKKKKTGIKGIVLTSTEWQLSWLSAPRPSASAICPLVFGQVRLDSTSGQNTASGQSPLFVAGHISGRCKPSAPSWGLVAPLPWQQPFISSSNLRFLCRQAVVLGRDLSAAEVRIVFTLIVVFMDFYF